MLLFARGTERALRLQQRPSEESIARQWLEVVWPRAQIDPRSGLSRPDQSVGVGSEREWPHVFGIQCRG
jgi:hypothetical protein